MSNFNSNWIWLVAVLSIIGTILNIKKKRLCFVIWIFSNSCLVVYNIHIWEYQQATLFFVYLCLSIWGVITWKKHRR